MCSLEWVYISVFVENKNADGIIQRSWWFKKPAIRKTMSTSPQYRFSPGIVVRRVNRVAVPGNGPKVVDLKRPWFILP